MPPYLLKVKVMMRAHFCFVAGALLYLILPSQIVRAWSEGGHTIISILAYDILEPANQKEFLSIIESHPRYNDDFQPPKSVEGEQQTRRWRIGRVGYWPDIARSQPTYNRPNWHYELGASLIIGDLKNMNVPAFPGPVASSADLMSKELYFSQAVTMCINTACDKSNSKADRAIALCWIGHLVADSHQPCHAGSLYMEGLFPEGDRGANEVPTKQKKKLHALWDQLLGDEYTRATNRRIAEISGNTELTRKSAALTDEVGSLLPQTWLTESRELARTFVYAPEILLSLQQAAKAKTKPEPIDLSNEYLENAGRIAQVRASESSYRLAKIWTMATR